MKLLKDDDKAKKTCKKGNKRQNQHNRRERKNREIISRNTKN